MRAAFRFGGKGEISMLKVGDRVVHPVYGIGSVKSMGSSPLGGAETRQCYQVSTASATVWVPIDAAVNTGLRLLTSKRELGECRSLLKSRAGSLNVHYQKRHLELETRLKSGSLIAVCQVVRDLTALSRKKPLTTFEGNLLKKTFKSLSEEWAAAEGVSTATANQEIESLLSESKGRSAS
jgi:RNA polymerase-interacting CarD/CdnL/TRCF family regulator